MARQLPVGTVTFLFTDIEGSTRLLNELGAEQYARALATHRRLLRESFAQHGGVEVDTQGDSFFVAFPTAPGALAAAREAQAALAGGPLRVRMGLHTGTALLADEGYVGPDVHRAARVAAAGHGGQILLSAAAAALVPDSKLRDLGLHRLKDLSAAVQIFQFGKGDFPPLRTLYQSNLPVPPTPFLGRRRELADVGALLGQPDVRLVTLTGPGGTGKTRLALQAAAELAEHYPDGTWWVPLAALREPELVVDTAARAVGASDGLADHIGDRQLLLVFDNFEHVAEAATDIAALLGACPRLEVMATSREPLHLTGEHEYPVPPLATGEGTRLFISRARAVRPDFQPDDAVAEVCRRLDELPLAIELAAARVKALTPSQILLRLERHLPVLGSGPRDLPERQRTLNATIEWSYDLLEPDDRRLFARLAVFRGGCTLEAAEHVAGADVEGLESLVDKSLLRRLDDRFVMLETMRGFAAGRLVESGAADDVRRLHAHHFLALAEEAETHLWGFAQDWLDRLSAEHDNMRAALDHLAAVGDAEGALRLAGALQRFWIVRGHLAEGRRRLEALLEADHAPTAARGKALNGAALLAINTGDPVTSRARAEEALDIHRRLGDRWGEARSSFILGYASADEGDFERARRLFEHARHEFTQLGDEHNVLFVTSNLAWACEQLGDRDQARSLNAENLRRARELGNRSMEALSLGGLAGDALDDDRVADALTMWQQALRIDRDLDDKRRTVDDLCHYARGLAHAGQHVAAIRLLCAAEALHEQIGASVSPDVVELNRRTRQLLGQTADAELLERECTAGRELTFEAAFGLALAE